VFAYLKTIKNLTIGTRKRNQVSFSIYGHHVYGAINFSEERLFNIDISLWKTSRLASPLDPSALGVLGLSVPEGTGERWSSNPQLNSIRWRNPLPCVYRLDITNARLDGEDRTVFQIRFVPDGAEVQWGPEALSLP